MSANKDLSNIEKKVSSIKEGKLKESLKKDLEQKKNKTVLK